MKIGFMRSRLFCSALALTAGLIVNPAMAQSAMDSSNSATQGSGFERFWFQRLSCRVPD